MGGIEGHLRLRMDPPLLVDSTRVSLIKDWRDVLQLTLFFYKQRTLGRLNLDISVAALLA